MKKLTLAAAIAAAPAVALAPEAPVAIAQVAAEGPPACRTHQCVQRIRARRAARLAAHRARERARARARYTRIRLRIIRPYRAWLARTGDCENGSYGGAALNSGLDAYNPSPFFGRYQFTMGTWWSVGGRGDPRDAGWLEQAYRAILVLLRDGNGAWPVCGH